MHRTGQCSRRGFLKSVAVAAAAPYVVRSSALGLAGTVAPSSRVALGLIGCGLHGVEWNLPQIFRNPDEQVIAVCDVDEERMRQGEARARSSNARTARKAASTATSSMASNRGRPATRRLWSGIVP